MKTDDKFGPNNWVGLSDTCDVCHQTFTLEVGDATKIKDTYDWFSKCGLRERAVWVPCPKCGYHDDQPMLMFSWSY